MADGDPARAGETLESERSRESLVAEVSDFEDVIVPLVDRVSALIIRRALGDREDQETFALDELTRAMAEDPGVKDRIRLYAQRVVGEAFTQTARAMEATEGLRTLL